jgi:cyclic beta-1,2-glucan synthetase
VRVDACNAAFVEGTWPLLDPCIPKTWPGFTMTFQHSSTTYEIQVDNPDAHERGIIAADIDGNIISERPLRVPLVDDQTAHRLSIGFETEAT